ncbi:MAG TPA: glycoside hydrolase family 92 protein, partial [Chitinophagales bacterium]|nr:glycoside hydrolase family 92 protein [Chitinophagales bacterium]
KDDYNFFIKRAENYRQVFDTVGGFMHARQKHFLKGFDPYKVSMHYTEGNAWQYTFYAPQDLSGLMSLMGGKQGLATKLDSLFTTTSKLKGIKRKADITGLIGQYAHGNEPSHQIAYEYDYAGQAWKTQAIVRRIMRELYRAEPDGLAGNEDCGQMSAWYVFSAIGFYPVCPGSDQYALGSPAVDKAIIHLENGRTFTITAGNNSDKNVYIQSAKLGGETYTKSYITYQQIMNGGTLDLKMGPTPNTSWGTGENDVPVTQIKP